MDGIEPSPLPNRTGGFPASGSPVDGYSLRRLSDRPQALTQGDQALGVEEVIGPTLLIATPASASTSTALAQDASQPASGVTVNGREDVALAVLEVFKPAVQQAVEILTDRFDAPPLGAPCFGSEHFLEFGQALLARPFHAALEGVAKEVDPPGSWVLTI